MVSDSGGVAFSSPTHEREACEEDIKTLRKRIEVLCAEELLSALKAGDDALAFDRARYLAAAVQMRLP